MGRTLPPITQAFLEEEASFARFRRALRRSDQLALDDLFAAARQHLAAASYASHALPFDTILLCMVLEDHKQVMRLESRVEELEQRCGCPQDDEQPGDDSELNRENRPKE